MNPYLAKLRALTQENLELFEPSKPSEPGFDGFEGEQISRISENAPVELAQGYYRNVLTALLAKCPDHVEPDRWQQAIHDADSFLATWGAQAHTLGWTPRELLGLHAVPERPAATYRRLSRYDETGLIWLLQGRPVIALTETQAAILGHSGASLTYRHNKPALGPLGDSLDDMGG